MIGEWPQHFLEAAGRARSCVVLTGAGISAESGLATFRGADGWWRNYDPQQLATPRAFKEDPKLVWEWYHWRRRQALSAHPNAGHLAIARMEDLFPEFLLVTQNVDGLHQRAGSRKMVELHGSLHRSRCYRCHRIFEPPPEEPVPPRCPCGGLIRPDVVWFGEIIPQEPLRLSWERSARADLFLMVGTSCLVQPAASLPLVAKDGGCYLIEVNIEGTSLGELADLMLKAKAGEAMPEILDRLRETRGG